MTLYHNPRCSKSRRALELLRERGETVSVIEYLTHPPSVAELDRLCRLLAVEPRDLVRRKERRFVELGLAAEGDRRRREWLDVMARNPILIERPIAVAGDRAVVGRPPERVLEVL